jgi:hypothetical protein
MNKTLIAMILTAGLSLQASPLPKSQVAGDSKWVIHLDMEQFAPSQTCRLMMNSRNGAKSFQTMLNHYRTLLGVDPLKDISGITLYGREVTGNRGTALISGALNAQAITKQLSTYPQYTINTYGKLKLQTWTDKTTNRPLWACFYTTRLLILGSDESSILNATATLGGTKPNLATGKSVYLPMQTIREGSFFTAVTRGYAGSDADPIKAMILKNTDAATLQLSENKGIVDGKVLLKAISSDSALQIHQVLNGLMVAANMSDSASPLAKLAGMSDISRNDRNVLLKVHCPAADAADILAATMATP